MKLDSFFLFGTFSVALTILNFSYFCPSMIMQKAYGQHISNDNIYSNNDIDNTHYNNLKLSILTNNSTDSVYPHVAAFGNNVYVVWQQLVPPIASVSNASNNNSSLAEDTNYDIFIKKVVMEVLHLINL